MAQWYYLLPDGNASGLIDETHIRSMLENGLLTFENYVWDGTPATQGGKWVRIAETEIAITQLLLDIILYIIAKSDKKHFSKTKLQKYLILLNSLYPIGVTIASNSEHKNEYVEQLRLSLAILKNGGLISGAKRKGKHGATIYNTLISAPILPEQIEYHLNQLLLEYDQVLGSRMP